MSIGWSAWRTVGTYLSIERIVELVKFCCLASADNYESLFVGTLSLSAEKFDDVI